LARPCVRRRSGVGRYTWAIGRAPPLLPPRNNTAAAEAPRPINLHQRRDGGRALSPGGPPPPPDGSRSYRCTATPGSYWSIAPLPVAHGPTSQARTIFHCHASIEGLAVQGGRRPAARRRARRLRGQRIGGLSVLADFEVQVRPGAPPGAADAGNDLAARDGFAGLHRVR